MGFKAHLAAALLASFCPSGQAHGLEVCPDLWARSYRESRAAHALADHYLWDNWTLFDQGRRRYLKYSLSAAKAEARTPDGRHALARLRVFSSADGAAWKDEGLIWPDQHVWSGHTWQDKDGTFWLLHTRPDMSKAEVPQSLALASSRDGIRFGEARTLVSPEDPLFRAKAEALGYHLGNGDGMVMALRDPFRHEDTLYFAGKRVDPASNKVVPTIGRLKIGGARFENLELLPPLQVPVEEAIRQIEVPNLQRLSDGRYVLSVNLTDRVSDATPSEGVRSWVRFYESRSAEGPWVPARGPRLDREGNLYGPEDRVYGFNLLSSGASGEGGVLRGTGFYRRGARGPDHALTPIQSIEISRSR